MKVYLKQFARSRPTPISMYHFLIDGKPIVHARRREDDAEALHRTYTKMRRFFEPQALIEAVRAASQRSLVDLKIEDVWHVGAEYLVSFSFRSEFSNHDMCVAELNETEYGTLLRPLLEELWSTVERRDPEKFFAALLERIDQVERYHAKFRTTIMRGEAPSLKDIGVLFQTMPKADLTAASVRAWNALYESTMKTLEQSVIKLPALKSIHGGKPKKNLERARPRY